MNERELQLADTIIQGTNSDGRNIIQILGKRLDLFLTAEEFSYVEECLKKSGLIEIELEGEAHLYRLTKEGIEFKRSGKSFSDHLQQEAEKGKRQKEKDDLIYRDLHDRVNKINPEQYSVLHGTWERHKQSLLMVLIGVLIGSTITIIVNICIH